MPSVIWNTNYFDITSATYNSTNYDLRDYTPSRYARVNDTAIEFNKRIYNSNIVSNNANFVLYGTDSNLKNVDDIELYYSQYTPSQEGDISTYPSLTKVPDTKIKLKTYDDDLEGFHFQFNDSYVPGMNAIYVIQKNQINGKKENTVSITATLTNCVCNYNNGETLDNSKNIIITANTGYIFNELSYPLQIGNTSANFTISDDKATLTYNTANITDNVTLIGRDGTYTATEKEPVSTKIDLKLYYESRDLNINTITVAGSRLTKNAVSVTAIGRVFDYYYNGVTFDVSATEISITGNNVDTVNTTDWLFEQFNSTSGAYKAITPNTCKYQYETLFLQFNSFDSVNYDSILLIKKIPANLGKLSYTLSNCTCNYANNSIIGTDVTGDVKVTADNNYEFPNDVYTYTIDDKTYNFTKTSSTILTIPYSDIKSSINNIVFAINAMKKSTPTPTTGVVNITGTIKNANCNYSNGEQISTAKPLKITPIPGYEFAGVYTYTDTEGATSTMSNYNGVLTIYFTTDRYSITLDDNYIATQKTQTQTNFIRVYQITEDNLDEIATNRFETDFDYGQYIINLYKTNLRLSPFISDDATTINLGTRAVGEAKFLLKDNLIFSQFIDIPYKYSNAYDYINTRAYLEIPFFDKIELPIEWVVNCRLYIEVLFNPYECSLSLVVSSCYSYKNEQDEKVYSNSHTIYTEQNKKIGIEIPIRQYDTGVYGNYQQNITTENSNDDCGIIIVRNVPYTNNNYYGREVDTIETLDKISGYAKISEIELFVNATEKEKNEIIALLQNGVYF